MEMGETGPMCEANMLSGSVSPGEAILHHTKKPPSCLCQWQGQHGDDFTLNNPTPCQHSLPDPSNMEQQHQHPENHPCATCQRCPPRDKLATSRETIFPVPGLTHPCLDPTRALQEAGRHFCTRWFLPSQLMPGRTGCSLLVTGKLPES